MQEPNAHISKIQRQLLSVIFILIFLQACKNENETVPYQEFPERVNTDPTYTPEPYVKLKHPDWSKNATIYQVNLRQYTAEGTFSAFEQHLPRLKEMGIDILWIGPIHPIGEQKRKGNLGSPYSVKDYYDINPDFGTLEDFKRLVEKIHESGMYVILDWVGNHSAWDNELVETHPDWYMHDRNENLQSSPWNDWSDVVSFDYGQPELRAYMAKALRYWVEETDIDGFRCGVAGYVPLDFWENARLELEQIKPVFLLAEWESRDLHQKAFDMSYAHSLYKAMASSVKNASGIKSIKEYIATDVNSFPREAYRMTFTDNQDHSNWEGSPESNFGPALDASIILSATLSGMPLVRSGQEAGLNRPLKFFDKDEIEWKKHPNADLFRKLFLLKHQNKALWNGHWGGPVIQLHSDKPEQLISFTREMDQDKVIVLINYSPIPCTANIDFTSDKGKYQELFGGITMKLKGKVIMHFPPWSYKVLVRQ